jgi:transporter family protein
MKPWISFAIVSMIFAGKTSVIAKKGLVGISGEAGLTVRTLFVVIFVLLFAALQVPMSSLKDFTQENYLWLGLSGLTTAGSWIFYYKALKDGEVSTIALIDKGSILISILLACFILKEQITARTLLGGAMMLGGLAVIASK